MYKKCSRTKFNDYNGNHYYEYQFCDLANKNKPTVYASMTTDLKKFKIFNRPRIEKERSKVFVSLKDYFYIKKMVKTSIAKKKI